MAAAQALRDKIAATYGQISVLNGLEATRGEVFAAATESAINREAEAVQNVSDRLALLTNAKVPALTSHKYTVEQKLAAELSLYKREEVERLQAISKHEEEIKAAKQRLADAEREVVAVTKSLQELRQAIKHREDFERREADILAAERDEAIALIAAESDAEARRVLSGIDEAVNKARADVQAELDEELHNAEATVLKALNTYATTCRLRVKSVAGELGALATEHSEQTVKPALERMEAARLANHTAAQQLSHTRDRLAALRFSIVSGRDSGDDISGMASSFPLLPAEAGGRRLGRNAPASPDSSPVASPQARRSPVRATVDSSREPGTGRSSSVPRYTDTAKDAASHAANTSRGYSSPSHAGHSHGVPLVVSNPALGDVVATLEARDAHGLGLTPAKARKDLAALVDSTLAAWTKLGPEAGSHEAILAFLRATQAAVVHGSQPSATPTGKGQPAGLDVAAAYSDMAQVVGRHAAITAARARLNAAQVARLEAERYVATASGAAKVDAARALSAANAQLVAASAEMERVSGQSASPRK